MPSHDGKSKTRIGELANEFGLTVRALRVYEQKGLLSSVRLGPRRGLSGGARYYTASERERVRRILAAKAMGFTLAEIKSKLEREWAEEQGAPLSLSRSEIEAQIVHLKAQEAIIKEGLAELRRCLKELDRNGSPPT